MMGASDAATHEALAQRVTRLFEEQLRTRPLARRAGDVVPSVEAITVEWLEDVLGPIFEGARVAAFRVEDVSSGTHARHRIHLEWVRTNEPGRVRERARLLEGRPTEAEGARALELPATLFTKSLPDVTTRMIAGVTGHARTEGNFYMQLRPELALEIPHAYHSSVDRESFAALHLLEDVASTRGAVFCDHRTSVTRAMAEQMIDLLAGLHAHFHGDPRFEKEIRWLAPYDRWFRGGIAKLRIDYYNEQAIDRAAERIPQRLLARREAIWPATLRTLAVHETAPPTYLHSDVHIGNWYRTRDGRMGLCDWQCAARGHASRDVAYVLSAALAIDDRRAWERELVARYLDRFAAAGGPRLEPAAFFDHYRGQMLHALLMWTPTLCHSEHLPHMQSDETSLCMIERMTTAIDDLDSVECG